MERKILYFKKKNNKEYLEEENEEIKFIIGMLEYNKNDHKRAVSFLLNHLYSISMNRWVNVLNKLQINISKNSSLSLVIEDVLVKTKLKDKI